MEKIDLLVTLTQHERDANNVTIAFSFGMKAASQGKKVVLLLLSDAVHLAAKGYADKINIGAPFKPMTELLPGFLAAGGKIVACSNCLEHNGVDMNNLVEGVVIGDADFAVESIFAAEKTLQLN